MTLPFFQQGGPRPIQQLLQVMQFGEQQRLAEQQAKTQRDASSANIVQTFMNLAPNQAPEDRAALAQVLGRAAGVDPSLLMSAVAQRPQSAATTGDAAAFQRFTGIESPSIKRAADMISQVPDSTIMDAATNASTNAITGMAAGASRQSATMADRGKISDKDLVMGLTNQLGVTLDANQKKHYEVMAEQLRQGWSKIADDKTAEAARLAIMRGQLQLERDKMELLKQGRVDEAQKLSLGNPEETLKAIVSIASTASSGVLTQEARAALGAPLQAYAQQLAASMAISNPELAKEFLDAFSPEKVLNISPRGLTGPLKTTKK